MKKNRTNLILMLISIPAIATGLFEVASYYLGSENVWFFCVFVVLIVGAVIVPLMQSRKYRQQSAAVKRRSW
jgi:membrane protein YdbS with pleckstrin-like domain